MLGVSLVHSVWGVGGELMWWSLYIDNKSSLDKNISNAALV